MTKLTGFDGVRAIACLLVISHHAFQRLIIGTQPPWIAFFEPVFLTAASAGVSIFFVLSGALLSLPFWQAYFDRRNLPSIKEFIKRRAARIMPAFYLVLTLCFITEMTVLPGAHEHAVWRYLAGLTFTAGFHYITFFPTDVNGPFWSISFEVFSYVLLPVFMAIMFVFVKKRSFRMGFGYWLGVLAFILVANGLVLAYFQTDTVGKGWQYGLIGGAKYWMPNYNPIGFFAHYLLGILAAGLLAGLERNTALRETLARKHAFDYIAGLGIFMFFTILWANRTTPELGGSWQHQPYYYPYLAAAIAASLAVLPFTSCVGRLLDNRFFRFTAKISFGLYIWHQFIMDIYASTLFPDYFTFHCEYFGRWLGCTLLAVTTAYILATLSWNFLEKPILDKVHGRLPSPADKKSIKKLFSYACVIVICGAVMTNLSFYQDSAEAAAKNAQGSGRIQIEVQDIRSTNGQILVYLYNSPQTFPLQPCKQQTVPIDGNTAHAVFDNVPYGLYAAIVCHDENGNNKFDMDGTPEGTGSSNNRPGMLTFPGAKFILNSQEETKTIQINYQQ